MFEPTNTGSGESVLLTDRSARACTELVVVALSGLVSGVGSLVVVVALAVLVIVAPSAVAALTLTTSVKLALAPPERLAMFAVAFPVPPTGGRVNTKFGPAACVSETN